jgi:hypothetical protein
MKKLIICIFIFTAVLLPYNKAQALDPKGRAFMIMCTYGTVGGALLGFASLAFGSSSRAIAQGASLGLYAGIAFGAFVVTSHGRQNEPDTYEDQPGPPRGFDQPPGGGFGDNQGGFGGEQEEDSGGFFGANNRSLQIHEDINLNYKMKNKKNRDFSLPVYFNLVDYRF